MIRSSQPGVLEFVAAAHYGCLWTIYRTNDNHSKVRVLNLMRLHNLFTVTPRRCHGQGTIEAFKVCNRCRVLAPPKRRTERDTNSSSFIGSFISVWSTALPNSGTFGWQQLTYQLLPEQTQWFPQGDTTIQTNWQILHVITYLISKLRGARNVTGPQVGHTPAGFPTAADNRHLRFKPHMALLSYIHPARRHGCCPVYST